MSERIAAAPERVKPSAELAAAHQEKLAELQEAFRASPEAAPEASERAEQAREQIKLHSEQAADPAEAAPMPAPASPIFFSHQLNYRQTLASVQRKLPAVSRKFSQIIHTPAVEKTSELLESTVARPSVLLGTTWTALIVGTTFYLIARHYGYSLSGSELLFSFIVGALIGIAGEGLWKLLTRR